MQDKPSKSARKRSQHALQALGERLIGLPEEALRDIPLDDDLRDAVVAASRMTARGALRRQRQLIGKLMRRVDPAPVEAALASLTLGDRQAKAVFRQAEAWRDRIVANGRSELALFVAETGASDTEIERCVEELARCRNRSERRIVARRLFRAIHRHLGSCGNDGARVQKTAS